jgi:hypothetical protein
VSVADSHQEKEASVPQATIGRTGDTLCLDAIELGLTIHFTPNIPRASPAAEIRG